MLVPRHTDGRRTSHASDSNLGHDRVVPRVCGGAKQRSAKRGANQDGVQAISAGTKQLHLVRRDDHQRNGLPCREAGPNFTGASAKAQALLAGLTAHFQSLPGHAADAAREAQAALYGIVEQQALMLSFIDTFKLMALVFLGVIPIVLLMNRRASPGADAPPAH